VATVRKTLVFRTNDSIEYELPLRASLGDALSALCSCAIPGVIMSLLLGAPWGFATAAVAVLAAVWSVRRVARVHLSATTTNVRVVNFWRTHAVPWDDVVAVGMSAKYRFPSLAPPPTVAFWLPQREASQGAGHTVRRERKTGVPSCPLGARPAHC
jgi:hypothetical protein